MKNKVNARSVGKTIGVVVALLLVGGLGYLVVSNDGVSEEVKLEIFQQGAQYGYEQAVVQAVQLAVTCEQVPFRIENQTLNMIAVDCLQQAGEQ